MAKVIIQFEMDASGALTNVQRLGNEMKKAGDAGDKAKGQAQGFLSSFKSGFGAGVGIGAFQKFADYAGAAAQALAGLAARGTEVKGVMTSFQTLVGGSAGVLKAAREGTRGLVADFQLMQVANKGVLLGLPITAKEMGVLGHTAVALGKAMGVGPTEAMSDLVTGLGRGSAAILDNLGIVLNSEEAYKKYADSLGRPVKSLTDQEKKLAVYRAALEAAQATTKQMGDVQLTLGDRLQQARVAWDNLVDGIAVAIAESPELNRLLGQAVEALESLAAAAITSKSAISDVIDNALRDAVTVLTGVQTAATGTAAAVRTLWEAFSLLSGLDAIRAGLKKLDDDLAGSAIGRLLLGAQGAGSKVLGNSLVRSIPGVSGVLDLFAIGSAVQGERTPGWSPGNKDVFLPPPKAAPPPPPGLTAEEEKQRLKEISKFRAEFFKKQEAAFGKAHDTEKRITKDVTDYINAQLDERTDRREKLTQDAINTEASLTEELLRWQQEQAENQERLDRERVQRIVAGMRDVAAAARDLGAEIGGAFGTGMQLGAGLLDVLANLNDEAVQNADAWQKLAGAIQGAANAYRSGSAFQGAMAGASAGAAFGPWGAAIGAVGGAILGVLGGAGVERAARAAGARLGVAVSEELARAIMDTAAQHDISTSLASLLHITDAIEESGADPREFANQIADLMNAIALGAVPAAEGIEQLGSAFQQVADAAIQAGTVGDRQLVALIQRSRELGLEVPEITAFINEQLDKAIEGLKQFLVQTEKIKVAVGTIGVTDKHGNPVIDKETGRQKTRTVFEERTQIAGGLAIATPQDAIDQATIFSAVFWAAVKEKGIVEAADAMRDVFKSFTEALAGLGIDDEALAGIIGPIQRVMELTEESAPFRNAVEGAEGLRQTLEGLANTGYLTAQSFTAIQNQAQNAFQQMIDGGATSEEALAAIMPLLIALRSASEQYGFALDENTERLIRQAEEAGYAFPVDPIIQVRDAIYELIEAITGIPREVNIRVNTEHTTTGTPPPGGGDDGGVTGGPYDDGRDRVSAAQGFGPKLLRRDTVFLAHEGEHVLIVPKHRGFVSAAKGFGDGGRRDPRDPRDGDGRGGGGAPGPGSGTTTTTPVPAPSPVSAGDTQTRTEVRRLTRAVEELAKAPRASVAVAPTVNVQMDPALIRRDRQQFFADAEEAIAKGIRLGNSPVLYELRKKGVSQGA